MSFGAYHPAVINKEDHDYLNAHALKINEKGKWHHKDYEPHHKWFLELTTFITFLLIVRRKSQSNYTEVCKEESIQK